MKRMIFIIFIILGAVVVSAADKAGQIMEKVFKNMDILESAEIQVNTTIVEKNNKRSAQKVKYIKPDKIKSISVDSNTGEPLRVENMPEYQDEEIKRVSLYPACLFDPGYFYRNYDCSVKEKDERIKRGMEEIIAIRKGQEREYPQIRIFVKTGRIEMIRFYDIYGKRYYELKVKKYEKIKNMEFPVEMVEKMTVNNSKITRVIEYSDIRINIKVKGL